MKQIVCEMCGGKELIKQDGTYTCQSCGTKYSVEEAKKMMVTIDNSAKLENALQNARRARERNDYEQAEKYYSIVQMEEPGNWEANFYSTYYRAMGTNILEAVNSIANNIKIVLKDVKKLDNTTKQNEAIKQMSTDLFSIVSGSYSKVIANYNALAFGERVKLEQNHVFTVSKILALLPLFGKELISEFGKNEFTTLINIQCYETALKITNDKYYADELAKINPTSYELTRYNELIKSVNKELMGCGITCGIVVLILIILVISST
jgi:uncharacterized Zn finger protein (UPF0148 family)